ncbi:MAG TPA: serine hydrolase domain-containing protein [Longimicrobium sp.]|nr:serine hydrolase domain-containing protein [Longimicrobium sp.]
MRFAVLLAAAAFAVAAPPLAAQGDVRALAARLDSAVPALLAESHAPGAALAVVEGGRIVLARGYGVANVATGARFTAHTPVNVASVSKAVTAWGVMRLARDGTLPLDAPVNGHLRRWRLPDGAWPAESVTVRRLLSHMGGVSIASVPWFPLDSAAPSLEDVLSGRAGDRGALKIEVGPGTVWRYSGGGYTLLQLALEEASGEGFESYMRRRVLRPLGMGESGFGDPVPGAAVGYDEAGKAEPAVRYVGSSAAGLWASAHDFARLLRAYGRAWRGADRRVIGRTELGEMARPVAPVALEGVAGAFYGLGHGTHRAPDGRLYLYHSGGNPGFRAYLIVAPERGDGLFIAVNSDNGVPAITRVVQLWGEAHGGGLPPLF